jgi:benzylsuccinate CoA-transferase BbsF subunit
VVVENYTAGVMDKLGLGYDALRDVKRDLVMLASSGYGDSGPYRRYVTWGPNIEALSGLARLSGFPERECTITQYAYPDALSALHGLIAVMAALDHRRRTGHGQYINLSQLEATVSAAGHVLLEFLANGREPARRGNRSLSAAPHGCYRCYGEDRWIAIAVRDEDEWRSFCAALDAPPWGGDARFAPLAARLENAGELDRWIEEWTSARAPYEAMDLLQAAGVPAGVVQTVEDQFCRDRQLAARGFFEEIPHARKGGVVATGIPLGLTATPGRTPHTGRAIGADSQAVFEEIGLAREEIARLTDLGAIESPDG